MRRDVLARRKQLTTARAELLERPDVDLRGIPDHVAASWRRSLAGGVNPDRVVNRYHPDLDVESRLVRCARPVIDDLAEQTADSPVCLALTDGQARLLARIDNGRSIGREADGNNFATGFGFDEGAVGTNGVGTVLESGGPFLVLGAEHFVERLQDYACAGAPVRDPSTGRIEGVLDISCRVEHFSPIMHSLVRSAAARIQDALLHDRDVGWQALVDLYTRVDSRLRQAVIAVGHRSVLANTALQTLLTPDDSAALQDHARFLMLRGPRVDDRTVLPSGVWVRVRGQVVTVGGAVAGIVAVVTVLPDARAGAASRAVPNRPPLPEATGASPAWRTAWSAAAEALDARTPLLVVGEPGSGRRRLLADLNRALHGGEAVIDVGPADSGEDAASRIRGAGPSPLVVLTDLDQREPDAPAALVRALRGSGVRLAATATDPTRCTPVLAGLPVRFNRSVSVPPLRNRAADLVPLATAALAELAPGREVRLSAEAVRVLTRYDWPGNIGELREALEVALRRRPAGTIEVVDLPESCQSAPRGAMRPVDRAERDAIVAALRDFNGNRVAAAAALGVARSTLYRKIGHYGIIG